MGLNPQVDVVNGITKRIPVTPTLTVHANYVANDFVGTSGVAMVFDGVARVDGGSGWIIGGVIEDDVAEAFAMDLLLFDTAVTPPADSAAWTISDADMKHCQAVLSFGVDPVANLSAVNAVCEAKSGAHSFTCAAGSKKLYGCLVNRGTLATTGVTVTLAVIQD